MTGTLSPLAVVETDSRGSVRRTCEVPTTCQPASAWCKDPWPAVISDISSGGVSLKLARRFELGTGLAIELPSEYSGATTVLARVIHVQTREEGGWLLGCGFISELGDEEVEYVLQRDPRYRIALADDEDAPNEGKALPSINGVLFQAKVASGEHLRWYVKRLDLSAAWPLPSEKRVSLTVGGLAGEPPVKLKVVTCKRFGSYWIVDCKLRRPFRRRDARPRLPHRRREPAAVLTVAR